MFSFPLSCSSPPTSSYPISSSSQQPTHPINSGLPKASSRLDGSKCVPAIFNFLASYLSLPTSPHPFLPSEWSFSGTLSHLQVPTSSFCGQYTTTQALCLAFGYGLSAAFPSDHHKKMSTNRRRRYHLDLMLNGFSHYDSSIGAKNWQYYPLLSSSPPPLSSQIQTQTQPQILSSSSSSSSSIPTTITTPSTFHPLPNEILTSLPARVLRRRSCYLNCPDKATLTKHCLRNFRFYPQYVTYALDDRYGLKEYVEWVEEQDWRRRHGRSRHGVDVLDYVAPGKGGEQEGGGDGGGGGMGPQRWVDPRERGKGVFGLEEALWGY